MSYEIGHPVIVADYHCKDCGLEMPIGYKGDPEDLHPDNVEICVFEHHSDMNPTCFGDLVITINLRIWMNGDPWKGYRYKIQPFKQN